MQKLWTLLVLVLAASTNAQTPTDFTGRWRQQTKPGTLRQLEVEQKSSTLRVKTMVSNSEGTRNLEVRYEIGGPETTYKGLDGDEFRSSVRWDGPTLVFDTIEHEDASEIPQKVVWTLSADGNVLQVDKQVTKSGKAAHSSAAFVRVP